MKNQTVQQPPRSGERGGASVKFLMILTVIILIAHAGYNYIPVAYDGEDLKQEMQTAVVQTLVLPNNMDAVGITKQKIQRAIVADDIPPNAVIEVKQINNFCQARVVYSQPVKILPFGLYNYIYQFDHTATPSGFLAKSRS